MFDFPLFVIIYYLPISSPTFIVVKYFQFLLLAITIPASLK